MSHVPERPLLFACAECSVVHVGVRESEDHYRPPDHCSVCDSETFTELPDHP
ncbi:hypothetical protein ACFPYI_03190 [Halomarina salina]|uniref:Small CPxCG-related zinc finger protein n=1 Tax=Halomarina salina TaxID=1872699 RepID=A0ABD5RIM7_9EURY|nr:hypothetical protein [Halomarina salina]